MRRPLLLAAVLSTMLAPRLAHAADDQPRVGPRREIITGALVLGLSYGASQAVGLTYTVGRNVFCSTDGEVELRAIAGASTPSCPNRGYGWLGIPIAGPVISLAGYRQETWPAVLLVTDAALQLGGAALLTAGIVRSERAGGDRAHASTTQVRLVPSAPRATVGLSVMVTAF